MMLTKAQLQSIFPNASKDKIELYTEAFNKTLPQFSMNTPRRVAAFLGQIGVESGELHYTKELPSRWNKKNQYDVNEPIGSLYEGVNILGNNKAGDGPKFIGRGILQLTGRANYTLYAKKLNIDLVNNPDLAMDPEVSVKIACQYFADRDLNNMADEWKLDAITKSVNGKKMLHHAQRVAYSERALALLK